MSVYTYASVVNAIDVFNAPNPNSSVIQQASEYLEKFQESPEAWNMVTAMLADLNLDQNKHYFAANCLRNKIDRYFNELTAEQCLHLKECLIQNIIKNITTQLSLALAMLVVKLREWGNPIADLVSKFENSSKQGLVEVLIAIPEEIQVATRMYRRYKDEITESGQTAENSTLIAKYEYYSRRSHLFKTSATRIFHILHVYVTAPENGNFLHRIIDCYAAWLEYASNDIPIESISHSPFLTLLFEAISHDKLRRSACDAIEIILRITSENPKFERLIPFIAEKVLQCRMIYDHLAHAGDSPENSTDIAQDICQLFASLGEYYMRWIVKECLGNNSMNWNTYSTDPSRRLGLEIVSSVVSIMEFPDKQVVANTFRFWYAFIDTIHQFSDEEIKVQVQYFQSLWISALKICVVLLRYGDDENGPTEDERDYRKEVLVVIRDICCLLDAKLVLEFVFSLFREALLCHQNSGKWQSLESVISLLRAIARIVPEDENEFLPQIFPLLLQVKGNEFLRYSTVLTFGRYSDWIRNHAVFMRPVMYSLIQGLAERGVQEASALSILYYCEGCCTAIAQQNAGNAQLVLNEHSLLKTLFDAYYQFVVPEGVLSDKNCAEIIEGISMCLLECQSLSQISEGLAYFLNPLTANLMNAVSAVSITDVVGILQKMTSVIQTFHVSEEKLAGSRHPLYPMLEQVWPVMESIFASPPLSRDTKTMEAVCRFFKYTIREMGQSFLDCLMPLCTRITELYAVVPHSCCLYVVAVLVMEFGEMAATNPDARVVFGNLLQTMTERTFNWLNSIEKFRDFPDVVEDFFDMISRYIRHCPQLVYSSPLLPHIFRHAVYGVTLEHRSSHEAVCWFFANILAPANGSANISNETVGAMSAVLNESCAALVEQLVYAVLNLPKSRMKSLSSVITPLIRFNPMSVKPFFEHVAYVCTLVRV